MSGTDTNSLGSRPLSVRREGVDPDTMVNDTKFYLSSVFTSKDFKDGTITEGLSRPRVCVLPWPRWKVDTDFLVVSCSSKCGRVEIRGDGYSGGLGPVVLP